MQGPHKIMVMQEPRARDTAIAGAAVVDFFYVILFASYNQKKKSENFTYYNN